jgi:hypothetical protein
MSHPRDSRRALATMFAVFLIGLVATAMTGGALLLRNDVRRAAMLRTDAQLRQLLLGGTAAVIADSQSWAATGTTKESTWQLQLPDDLRRDGNSVSIHFFKAPVGMLKIHMIAVSDNRQSDEELQFDHVGDSWQLADIELGPVSSVPSHAK